jgi:hypothetical protein
VSNVADLGQAALWHRQIAALATAADRAGVGAQEFAPVRTRLLAQQTRFPATAQGDLIPSPDEVVNAGAALGDHSPENVQAAVATASSTLDSVDRALGNQIRPTVMPGHDAQPTRPAALRNGLIYGGYAVCVAIAQIALLLTSDDEQTLPITAPLCLIVLPAFAWLAGFVTISAIFGRHGGPPVKRSPRLGAIICFLPDLGLCAWVGLIYAIGHA